VLPVELATFRNGKPLTEIWKKFFVDGNHTVVLKCLIKFIESSVWTRVTG